MSWEEQTENKVLLFWSYLIWEFSIWFFYFLLEKSHGESTVLVNRSRTLYFRQIYIAIKLYLMLDFF